MAGISVASSASHKRAPKVLKRMEIEPRLGGGHVITHHYSSFQHEPDSHEFEGDEGDAAMKHIAKHAGLPHPKIGLHDTDRPEPITKDEEEL